MYHYVYLWNGNHAPISCCVRIPQRVSRSSHRTYDNAGPRRAKNQSRIGYPLVRMENDPFAVDFIWFTKKKSMAMFNGYVRLPDGIHCNAWRKFWLKAVPQNYPWELQYHIVIELALLEEFQENGMDPMADLDISPKKRPVGTVEAYCQKQFHATEMKSHSQQQDVRRYILGTGVSGRVTDLLAAFFETSELICVRYLLYDCSWTKILGYLWCVFELLMSLYEIYMNSV